MNKLTFLTIMMLSLSIYSMEDEEREKEQEYSEPERKRPKVDDEESENSEIKSPISSEAALDNKEDLEEEQRQSKKQKRREERAKEREKKAFNYVRPLKSLAAYVYAEKPCFKMKHLPVELLLFLYLNMEIKNLFSIKWHSQELQHFLKLIRYLDIDINDTENAVTFTGLNLEELKKVMISIFYIFSDDGLPSCMSMILSLFRKIFGPNRNLDISSKVLECLNLELLAHMFKPEKDYVHVQTALADTLENLEKDITSEDINPTQEDNLVIWPLRFISQLSHLTDEHKTLNVLLRKRPALGLITRKSALHYAFGTEAIRILLEAGADPNQPDENGRPPFYEWVVLTFWDKGRILLFLNHGANLNLQNQNQDSILMVLLSERPGVVESARFIIENGADIYLYNNNGISPVCWAFLNLENHEQMASLILDYANKTKPKGAFLPILKAAVESGKEELIKEIFRASINDKDDNGLTPLICASYLGSLDLAKYFLVNGAEVDNKGFDGWTSLMNACLQKHNPIITLLVESGANVNLQNNVGEYALSFSFITKDYTAIKFLLEHGADPDLELQNGQSVTKMALAQSDYITLGIIFASRSHIFAFLAGD